MLLIVDEAKLKTVNICPGGSHPDIHDIVKVLTDAVITPSIP